MSLGVPLAWQKEILGKILVRRSSYRHRHLRMVADNHVKALVRSRNDAVRTVFAVAQAEQKLRLFKAVAAIRST
jgi:hypothetical protein